MGEGPSPFVPARPRSGDHIVDAGLDRKKERSLLPARTTSAVMTVQTLSRSSTPGSIVSARAEVSKPSKSSFGPPSKNGKAYQEQFQRPSKKEVSAPEVCVLRNSWMYAQQPLNASKKDCFAKAKYALSVCYIRSRWGFI